MAISIMETTVKITARDGYLLHNGAGMYAREVFVPIGVSWDEIPDDGQLEPVAAEILQII